MKVYFEDLGFIGIDKSKGVDGFLTVTLARGIPNVEYLLLREMLASEGFSIVHTKHSVNDDTYAVKLKTDCPWEIYANKMNLPDKDSTKFYEVS